MRKLESNSVPLQDDHELTITKLTQIHGIARKTALAMYEMGIHSYTDLVDYLNQYTPEQLSAKLKQHGVNRAPGLIDTEVWIREAEQLAQAGSIAPIPLEENTGLAEDFQESQSIHEIRDHGCVFTVSFDTVKDDTGRLVSLVKVYDEGNGGKEAIFQGTQANSWVNWILERANLPLLIQPFPTRDEAAQEPLPVETKAAALAISGTLKDYLLEIKDVRLSVIGQELSIPDKMLKAEIILKLSGPDAEGLTLQSASFRTEIYAINLSDGFPLQMGSKEDQLRPHVLEYSYQFEVAIPVVGHYELHSVVRWLSSGKMGAYYQGPVMRVTD